VWKKVSDESRAIVGGSVIIMDRSSRALTFAPRIVSHAQDHFGVRSPAGLCPARCGSDPAVAAPTKKFEIKNDRTTWRAGNQVMGIRAATR